MKPSKKQIRAGSRQDGILLNVGVFLPIAISGVFLLLLHALTEPSATASLRELNLKQLCGKSDRVACGEVLEMRSYRGPFLNLGEIIFTDVTIRITEVICGKFANGELSEGKLTIQVAGGKIGDEFTICANSPRYERGEKVLVFLRPYNGRLWNTGWSHGKFRLRESTRNRVTVTTVEGRSGSPIVQTELLRVLRQRIQSYPVGVSR